MARIPPGSHRYPLQPLLDFIAKTTDQRPSAALGCSGSTLARAAEYGFSDESADRYACRLGLHPYEVWPEMADHHIEASSVPCANCGELFIPKRRDGRFCQPICYRRFYGRQVTARRRQTPEGAEANRARRRRYYAENAAYERARERRRYRARNDAARERQTAEAA